MRDSFDLLVLSGSCGYYPEATVEFLKEYYPDLENLIVDTAIAYYKHLWNNLCPRFTRLKTTQKWTTAAFNILRVLDHNDNLMDPIRCDQCGYHPWTWMQLPRYQGDDLVANCPGSQHIH